MFVSPDAGGVERARAYSKRLDATLAIIDKRRERANVTEVMNIIGDVKGKDCIIVDDMVDTAGTLSQRRARADGARRAPRRRRARRTACSRGPAVQRIDESPLEEVVVTDTIPLVDEAASLHEDQASSRSRACSARRSSASTTATR